MATDGITGIGTTLAFNGNTIGELLAPGGGNRSANVHPVLTCDSTSGYADKIVGAFEAGQLPCRFVYQPGTDGNYADLDTDFHAKTKGTLLVTFPTGSTLTGQAVIQSLGDPTAGEADGVLEFDVTFERAGATAHAGV